MKLRCAEDGDQTTPRIPPTTACHNQDSVRKTLLFPARGERRDGLLSLKSLKMMMRCQTKTFSLENSREAESLKSSNVTDSRRWLS